ncbi:UV protection and mutation protein [Arsukibacterium sp. MJ3]|nr:translesion error-prone DNA polymerase V autoproteolytic subunit [Arsukibacterium sp. MJ3]KKO50213.1 UV protection and mutation protein [Arsukibacterium sp. MJ3]
MSAVFLGNADVWPTQRMPFYSDPVKAGFPSPAQDYIERTLDLNELCIRHPNATFFVRVEGDSMIDAGIFDGDVLVVDRSIDAEHGDIVVAAVGSEFTVKQLCTQPVLQLLPRNPAYPPICLQDGDELNIFGVVTNVIRQMKRK